MAVYQQPGVSQDEFERLLQEALAELGPVGVPNQASGNAMLAAANRGIGPNAPEARTAGPMYDPAYVSNVLRQIGLGGTANRVEPVERGIHTVGDALNPAPQIVQGIGNAAAGVAQGDPVRAAGGVGQAGFAALGGMAPGPGAATAGGGAVMRTLFGTTPRTVGSVTAAGVAPVAASGALSPPTAEAGDTPDVLTQLYNDRGQLAAERETARTERDRQATTGKGPKYRAAENAYQQAQARLDALDERIKRAEYLQSPEYQAELKRKEAATPFRDRYPEIAGALPGIGIGLAAGVPGILRAAGRFPGSFLPTSTASRLARATGRVERAIERADPQAATTGAQVINAMLAARPTQAGNALKTLGVAGSGGALAAEANMYPEQYDAYNLPPGSPEQIRARENALNPMLYLERGAMGTLTGLAGYEAGGLAPYRSPDWARAQGAAAITQPGFGADVLRTKQNMMAARQRVPAPTIPDLPPPASPPSGPAPQGAPGIMPSGPVPAPSGQGQPRLPGPNPGSNPRNPRPGSGGSSSNLTSTVKTNLRDRYIQNGGTLGPQDIAGLAPNVPANRVQAYVKQLDNALAAAGDINTFQRMSPYLKAGLGVIGAGAAANAMYRQPEE